jgi:hypothetical protein
LTWGVHSLVEFGIVNERSANAVETDVADFVAALDEGDSDLHPSNEVVKFAKLLIAEFAGNEGLFFLDHD